MSYLKYAMKQAKLPRRYDYIFVLEKANKNEMLHYYIRLGKFHILILNITYMNSEMLSLLTWLGSSAS